MLLFVSLAVFTSCDKDEDQIPEPEVDLASEVVGTYVGKISYEGVIYTSDYTVTIRKVDNTTVQCEGEDDRLPVHQFEIKEADEISGVDWITQSDTYQVDSVFTFVRADKHLTIIRKDLNASFDGTKQ